LDLSPEFFRTVWSVVFPGGKQLLSKAAIVKADAGGPASKACETVFHTRIDADPKCCGGRI
jgi:hypothetical protein